MDAIKIKIGSEADTGGFDKMAAAEKRATDAAHDFVDAIKQGVGIDIGGRLVESVAAIPAMFKEAISKGVEFNFQMNNAEVGIANVLAKFMDLDKVAARRESAKAMAQLKDEARTSTATFSQLVEGFLATVASSQSLGISVTDNISLVTKFANAMQNLNLPAEQLAQELRSIISGNITADSQAAKMLGISNEDIKKAQEAGNVYQFLIGKLGSVGEAGDSAAARMSNFEDAVDAALGQLAKPISDALLDGIKELSQSMGDTDTTQLQQLGREIAQLVKEGVSFTQWVTQNTNTLVLMGKAMGIVVAAYAAFKIADIVAGLGLKARAILANTAALTAETQALAANTAAQTANGAARGAGAGGIVGGARGMIATPTGTVLAAAGAAYGAVQVGYSLADLAAGSVAGGKSSAADLTEAAKMRNENTRQIAELTAAVKNVKSEPERDALRLQLAELIQKSVGAQHEAGFTEEGRTAQNQALSDHAAALKKLVDVLQSKDGLQSADQVQAEAQAKAAKAKADAEIAANAEKDKKAVDDFNAKNRDRLRDQTASDKLDEIRKLMDKGDTAGAAKSLDEQADYYRQLLQNAQGDQGKKSGDDLKENLALQDALKGYLDDVEKARTELPEAIKKADEEAAKKQIEALEDQKALVEAEGEKRLADLDASGLKEDELARRRKAVEDDIAQRRLDLENQIGALQGESDTKREARAVEYAAGEVQRAQAVKQAEVAANGGPTKPGELFANSRRRRGLFTSDAFEDNTPLGQSALDKFKNSQPGMPGYSPVGSINGSNPFDTGPALPPPPVATPAGGAAAAAGAPPAPGQPPGEGTTPQDAAKKIADEGQNLAKALKPLVEAMVKAIKEVGDAIVKTFTTLRQELQKLKERVAELERE